MRHVRRSTGFSLVEVLIVITIMSIMAGLVAVNMTTNLRDALAGAAEVVRAEVAYARSLAVTGNSTYQLRFDVTNNQFNLTHTGANAALNTLPVTAFHTPADTATEHIVLLAGLPQLGNAVRLHGVAAVSSTSQGVTSVAFGPLGETSRTANTVIWLEAGRGTNARYLSVTINAVTGLTTTSEFTATAPTGL